MLCVVRIVYNFSKKLIVTLLQQLAKFREVGWAEAASLTVVQKRIYSLAVCRSIKTAPRGRRMSAGTRQRRRRRAGQPPSARDARRQFDARRSGCTDDQFIQELFRTPKSSDGLFHGLISPQVLRLHDYDIQLFMYLQEESTRCSRTR